MPAIITLYLPLSLVDPFRPEVEEERKTVEMGQGAQKLWVPQCEDVGSGAVYLPLSHNSLKSVD